jgi:selenocysteine-specific elongation factor
VARTHLIIGTAGHIDHGKTTLIRTLTGVDLDRLPEERARGITIALGFTHTELPSGRIASFVDVPGHERLVRTMIAGATGLDAVMLCVAATEGVMPQTREHLDILRLLGVGQGFVVLTMCDLVDEETQELARLDIEDVIAGSFLQGAPILATAAGEQPMGMDAVRAQIDQIIPESRSSEGIFRLPIDRAFIQRGFGTVVTGTARAGTLEDGAEVSVHPIGLKARVRGLQIHGQARDSTQAGQRTAINLAGIERDDLARGMVIVSDPDIAPASILDCRLRLLPSAPTLETGTRVRVLVGTAEVMAVADLMGEHLLPGDEHWVQLRTDQPISAFPGDRFILRRESPVQTLGGGQILDPWAPRARRKDRSRFAEELAALATGDTGVFLARAGLAGMDVKAAARRGIEGGVRLGDRVLHPTALARLSAATEAVLQTWHADHPLAPGAPRRALATGILQALPERSWGDLLQHLHEAGRVVLDGPRARLPSFEIVLDTAQEADRTALEESLKRAGLEGLKYGPTVETHPDLLHLLLTDGTVVRVGEHVIGSAHLEALKTQVRAFLRRNNQMHPADFKSMTGLSRRHAIPLMEWMDAQKVTVRTGDARVVGSA